MTRTRIVAGQTWTGSCETGAIGNAAMSGSSKSAGAQARFVTRCVFRVSARSGHLMQRSFFEATRGSIRVAGPSIWLGKAKHQVATFRLDPILPHARQVLDTA